MIIKCKEKERALKLRGHGLTYSEILKEVAVVKSTLSLWLRSVGLTRRQKQIITEKRTNGQKKGAQIRRDKRKSLQNQIYIDAEKQINKISDRELWLLGIALYWAEGSKEKEYKPGSGVCFSNGDPRMIALFLQWLEKVCYVSRARIGFEIYIHENYQNRIVSIQEYWSNVTKFPTEKFAAVIYKKHNIRTKRKNIGDLYYGVLRVKVKASSELLRKIEGWVRGIVNALLK